MKVKSKSTSTTSFMAPSPERSNYNVRGRKSYKKETNPFQQQPSNRNSSYSSENEKSDIEKSSDMNQRSSSMEQDDGSDYSSSSDENNKPASANNSENTKTEQKSEKHNINDESTKWYTPTKQHSIILVFGILIACGICWSKAVEMQFGGTKIHKNCSFQNLKLEFPQQDKQIWDELKIGVEDLLNSNPTQPKVYLYLHDNTKYSKKLINDIAETSSACFDPSSKPIKLNKEDFLTSEYGQTIEKYKENIHSGSVLIVLVNLNEIPGKNARALHAICDTYTPINNIRKILIILTLAIDQNHDKGKPVEIAEAKLHEIWSSTIQQNELSPLITRVTDDVFRLRSE